MGNQTTVCGEEGDNNAAGEWQYGGGGWGGGYETAGHHRSQSYPSRGEPFDADFRHPRFSDANVDQGSRGLSVDDVSVSGGSSRSRGGQDNGRGVGFVDRVEAIYENPAFVSGHGAAGFHSSGSDGGFREDAGGAARLPKSFFDAEIGESPILEDESLRHQRVHIQHNFRTGAFYDGQWLEGMRDGTGRMQWVDGTEYVGEWQRGRANGHGRILHRDGDLYHGMWVNGRAHGLGCYDFQHGAATYRGEFRCDLRDGLGIESWADGSSYEGEFRRGEKTGFGQTRWPDGSYYMGKWRGNQLEGPGQLKTDGGQVYKGQWSESSPSGIGLYMWPSGKRYEGGYLHDKKHGFGILREPMKQERKGFWEDGELVSTRVVDEDESD